MKRPYRRFPNIETAIQQVLEENYTRIDETKKALQLISERFPGHAGIESARLAGYEATEKLHEIVQQFRQLGEAGIRRLPKDQVDAIRDALRPINNDLVTAMKEGLQAAITDTHIDKRMPVSRKPVTYYLDQLDAAKADFDSLDRYAVHFYHRGRGGSGHSRGKH